MASSEETKIIYHVDDEETPYLVKIPKPPAEVTLGDFKNVINRPNYKFFFKSMDDDFGVVKEEIIEDDAPLPCFNGRVVSWVVPPDEGSNDGNSVHSGEGSFNQQAVSRSSTIRKDRHIESDAESICSRRSTRSNRSRRYESETESRRMRGRSQRDHRDTQSEFDASSVMSSDLETTSFVDSDEDSRMSSVADSKYGARQRRRRRKQRMPRVERCSSFSTITESTMSLNIITVVLNMDKINFLGISIVGQANKKGDGGIYVGSVMKGGAVDADGRIEPGDMILAVGDVNFENMSNDDAVRVLRECVHKPGPISLTVAKCWDPNPKGYFTVPRNDVTRPIDPAAWMQHSEAVRASGGLLGGRNGSPSMSTMTSTSDSLTSSIPEADRYLDHPDLGLSIKTDMNTIVKVMASADSGLVVRDRMWLKITIPNAFIGSDLVDWLFAHVDGFQDRRDARKFASKLLKANLIKHTVNKVTFSEQCYYVFGDLTNSLKGLTLQDIESGEMMMGQNQMQTGSWIGQQHSPYMMTPGGVPIMHPAIMMQRGPGSVTSASDLGNAVPPNYVSPPPHYADMFQQQPPVFQQQQPMFQQQQPMFQPQFNPYFAQHPGSGPPSHGSPSQHTANSGSNHSAGSGKGSLKSQQGLVMQPQPQMVMPQRDIDQITLRSSGSSERSHGSKGSATKANNDDTMSVQSLPIPTAPPNGAESDAPPPRELGKLETLPQDMSASRQSFRMAMGNSSNEFFVDVM